MNATTTRVESDPGTELVERYAHQVGRHLPRARRADVTAELRALLHDQIDDLLESRPDGMKEETTIEVLRELGPPESVARRYAPMTDVWIGPELYPTFRTTAFVVLLVYSILTGLWAVGVFSGSITVLPFQFEFDASRHWLDVVLGAIANVGVVALVFGVADRISRSPRTQSVEWDPRELPVIEDRGRISVPGEVLSLAATALFAFLFNFAPRWLGLLIIRGDGWGAFPVLAPGYEVHLPWMNAWWAGAFALHLGLLWRGRWTVWSRTVELGLGLLGAVILYRVVSGGPFTFLDVLAKPILWVALVVTLIDSVIRAVRLLRESADGGLEAAYPK